MTKWKTDGSKVYTSPDNKYIIRNVGINCWGVCPNNGVNGWEFNWAGSTYPTAAQAMNSIKAVTS